MERGSVGLADEAEGRHHQPQRAGVSRLVRDVVVEVRGRFLVGVDTGASTKSQPKRAPTWRAP